MIIQKIGKPAEQKFALIFFFSFPSRNMFSVFISVPVAIFPSIPCCLKSSYKLHANIYVGSS